MDLLKFYKQEGTITLTCVNLLQTTRTEIDMHMTNDIGIRIWSNTREAIIYPMIRTLLLEGWE